MIVHKWDGISCDLSVSSLIEGLRQLRQRTSELVLCVLVHPDNRWVLDIHTSLKGDYNKIARELSNIPFMFSKLIHKQGFIIVAECNVFIGSDPID